MNVSSSSIPTVCSILLLEGNVGSGKTSIARVLHAHSRCKLLREEIGDRLLQLFYANTERYAFTLQLVMQSTRLWQLRNACATTACTMVTLDRSVLGDYVFALWNWATGDISDDEFDVYRERAGYGVCDALYRAIGDRNSKDTRITIVYLRDTPEQCHARVVDRDQADSTMTLEYARGVHAMYELCVAIAAARQHVSTPYRVVTHNWHEYAHIAAEPSSRSSTPLLLPEHNAVVDEFIQSISYTGSVVAHPLSVDDALTNINTSGVLEKCIKNTAQVFDAAFGSFPESYYT